MNKIFLYNCLNCFGKNRVRLYGKYHDKLWQIYSEGMERLRREMNLSRIVKDVRNIKIDLRKRGLNGFRKLRIKNSAKNIIEADSELTEIESLSYDEYNFPELEAEESEDYKEDPEIGDLQDLKDELNYSEIAD